MVYRKFLVGYKVMFGLLGLSAVVTEMVVLINRGHFVPANFFSFFTIESNIFAAIILLMSALALSRKINYSPLLRGAATLYMVTTGIVFWLLLSRLDAAVLTAVPWDNVVLHYIMPFAVFLDWLLDPPKKRIPLKKALTWLVFPFAYVAYSLLRGHIVGWYPYPFLNPANHGYTRIAFVCLCITIAAILLTGLLIWLGGIFARKQYR